MVDFGLARAVGEAAPYVAPAAAASDPGRSASSAGEGQRLTEVGAVLGTPGYMSPEQVRGEEADARSDQFSFCAALYQALYGQLPFGGETFAEFSREILAGRLRKARRSDVPLVVARALLRGLETDPAARFPSMKELIAQLFIGSNPDSELPATRRARRWFGSMMIASVAIAATMTTPFLGLFRDQTMRGPIKLSILFLGVLLLSLLILRHTLLRLSRYRRIVYFAVVITGFMLCTRSIGLWIGLSKAKYFPIEQFALAALFLNEAPRISRGYVFIAAVFCGTAVLSILLPQFGQILISSIYPLTGIVGIYLGIRQSEPPTVEAGDAARPRSGQSFEHRADKGSEIGHSKSSRPS